MTGLCSSRLSEFNVRLVYKRTAGTQSDSSVPTDRRPKLVTTAFTVRQSVAYERPARSVPRFALRTAPVLTFLFTGRDAAITMNSVKIEITQHCSNEYLADQ